MMRSLFVTIFFTAALLAQPVVSNVRVTPSHGSVLVRADITNSPSQSTLQLETGLTSALGTRTMNLAFSSATAVRSLFESGLSPSTMYYFRIRVVASTGTTLWSCTPGSSGPGWTCDDVSGIGLFTTEPLPANHGAPVLPAELDTRMPLVSGQSFSVAPDCGNLQSVLNSCAAANPGLVHQVLVPASAVCRGTFNLPAKTGPGVCVVRSAAPDVQLPPEGVGVDPSYASKMPRFVLPHSATGELPTVRGIFNSAGSTEGWRLMGLSFELDSPLAHRKIPISNVAADGTITTSVPHGLDYYQQIYIAGVQGFRGRGPNGSWGIFRTGPSTFMLRVASYNVMGAPNFTCSQTPCYVPGTGYIVQTMGTAIASATAGTPPVVATQLEHGLFNEPWWDIVSISGSTVTLQSGHSIDNRQRTVEIEGSSIAAYNGVWITPGAGTTTLSLTGVPTEGCAAGCGRIRVKRTIHIRGAKGANSLNGNHLYTVLDDHRVQIDDATGGVYEGSGVLAFDPDYYFNMLKFSAGGRRIIVDRCLLKGAEWPNRMYTAIALLSSDSAVIDSRIENVKNWRSINPRTEIYEYGHDDFFSATSTAIDITRGDRKKIHNNYINANGISIFAQEFNGGDVVEDVTVTRNVLYSAPEDMAGRPASNGLYYPKRHHFEMKQGKRFLIEGNVLDGNWSDWTPCGPAIVLSPRAASYTTNQVADVTIRNNTLRNSSGGVQIAGNDSNTDTSLAFMVQRVRIEGNLLYDIDLRKWASEPNAVGATGVCGYAFQALRPVEDLLILRNTAFDMRGKQPQFFSYGYGRSEGVVVRDNLFTHNHDNSAGALTPSSQLSGFTPSITGTIKQGWDQYFRSGSDLSDNVVIPGVKSSLNQATYDSFVTHLQTYTKAECTAYYNGFAGTTCIGSGSATETANQRFAAMKFFNSGRRDFRLRFDSPGKAGLRSGGVDSGADMIGLERTQGKVRNLRVRPRRLFASLNYLAPDSAACFIDYGTDPSWSSHMRLSDGGGPFGRNVALNGLAAATLYYYRLSCASEQFKGSFVTAR